MVVQEKATSTNANTGGIVGIHVLEVKKRAIISNRICKSLSINNGSSEE